MLDGVLICVTCIYTLKVIVYTLLNPHRYPSLSLHEDYWLSIWAHQSCTRAVISEVNLTLETKSEEVWASLKVWVLWELQRSSRADGEEISGEFLHENNKTICNNNRVFWFSWTVFFSFPAEKWLLCPKIWQMI